MGAGSGPGPGTDRRSQEGRTDAGDGQEQDDRDWYAAWDQVLARDPVAEPAPPAARPGGPGYGPDDAHSPGRVADGSPSAGPAHGPGRGSSAGPGTGAGPADGPDRARGTAARGSGPGHGSRSDAQAPSAGSRADLDAESGPGPDAFVDFAEGLDDEPVRTGGGTDSGGTDGGDGVEEALALVGRRPAAPQDGEGPPPEPDSAAPPPGRAAAEPGARHRAVPWPEARERAARAGRETGRRTGTGGDRVLRAPLDGALGLVLAEDLPALCDLPSFDTSAMDGWVVAGPGPWTVDGDAPVLAGRADPPPLPDGTAIRIATGARIPPETTAVIRSEHARTDPARGLLTADRTVTPGQDIRPRAQECRSGEQLLPAGALVTPAVLGLAAAAGYDALAVVARPTVEVLVLGDELLDRGLPRDGLIRDALGPMAAPWLRALGADVLATHRIGDDETALHNAVTSSAADLLVTTGGTAAGPVDHVHPVLRKAGAGLLVDGVAVRPGHPMLLAGLPAGKGPRLLVGLPGNPLAAVAALLTLAAPLLRGLAGLPEPVPYTVPVRDEVPGHPQDTRLVPVVHHGPVLVPLRYNGPAMLRGIAAADGLAVVPPGGARPGDELEVLDLPLGR